MKKVFVFLLAASAAVAMSSCSKSSSPSTTARVMLVNGCSGSAAVGLSINGTNVPNATAVGYLDSSGYQSASSGNINFNIFITSNQSSLGTFATALTAGSSYSIFVGGLIQNDKDSVFITNDNLTAPTGNNAEVRLVNTCPDTGAASITAVAVSGTTGNTTIASGVAYQTATAFTLLPAGSYIIKVEGSSLASEQNSSTLQFNAGKIYTIMYSGTSPIYNVTIIPNN